MSNALVPARHTHATAPVLVVGHATSSGPSHVAPQRYSLEWSGKLTNLLTDVPTYCQRMMAVLDNYYRIRGRSAVLQFVTDHPELIVVLLEAAPALARYFGPTQRATLQLVLDPEAEGEQELVAHVRTTLPVAEALERLDKLDQGWLLDRVGSVSGLFNVNLVFV